MGAGARVATYLAALAMVFAASWGAGAALVPDHWVDQWTDAVHQAPHASHTPS